MTRFPRIFPAVVALAATVPVRAGVLESPFVVISGQRNAGFVEIALDDRGASELASFEGGFLLGLPSLGGEASIDVELERVSAVTPESSVVVGTRAGEFPLDISGTASFFGTVVGEEDSAVFLSVSAWSISGYIERDGRVELISSGPSGAGGPARSALLIDASSPAADGIALGTPGCFRDTVVELASDPGRFAMLATDEAFGTEEDPEKSTSGALDTRCRVVRLAVDTDWELTRDLFGGNAEASAAYLRTLLDAVSAVIRRDSGAVVTVPFLRVWADPSDPYADDYEGLFGYLDGFRDHWLAEMDHVDRDLAHMITSRRNFSDAGGLGIVGSMCEIQRGSEEEPGDRQRNDFGISAQLTGFFPTPVAGNQNGTWDLWIIAHELGHNLGARHTFNAGIFTPPIDRCTSGDCSVADNDRATIMSYCWRDCPRGLANTKLRFHPRQIGQRIGPELARKEREGCISAPEALEFTGGTPGEVEAEVGGSFVLYAPTSAPPGDVEYEWLKDGQSIPGERGSRTFITGVRPGDAGVYTARAIGLCETIEREIRVSVEYADCDASGTIDSQELAGNDLNANGVLDTCEGPLGIPRELFPARNGVVFSREFVAEWAPVRDATAYSVRIVTATDEETVFEAGPMAGTTVLVPGGTLERTESYRLRVRAIDDILERESSEGYSPFSFIPKFCLGDTDDDGVISFADLTGVLLHWGTAGPAGDANGNGIVDMSDAVQVLIRWGEVCE